MSDTPLDHDHDLKQITNCALCPNMCRFACPVAQTVRSEAVTPSGKARIAYLMAHGHLGPSAESYSYLYQCLLCGACKEQCPFAELDLAEELEFFRARATADAMTPTAAVDLVARLNRDGTIFEPDASSGLSGAERFDVLYFRGCATRGRHAEIEGAVRALLDAAGVSWGTLSDERCCGFPAACFGYHRDAGRMAVETAAAIKASGAKVLLTGCPECYDGFTRKYPEHGLKLGVEVRHVSVFLLDLVEAGRLRLPSGSRDAAPDSSEARFSTPRPVVYHDPCVLARRAGIIDEPRRLLASIIDSGGENPALEALDPLHSGRETACCGAGGLFHLVRPDAAREIAATRAGELEKTRAEAIVTACPFCREWLGTASRLPVYDLAEFTAMAAGIAIAPPAPRRGSDGHG